MKKPLHKVICDLCEAKVIFNMLGCPKCGYTGFNESEVKAIESESYDIKGWLQDAVGDLAGHDVPTVKMNMSFGREDWKKKIEQAEKDGVRDIPGWLADEFYNDVDTLSDLSGDRIHDAATTIIQRFKSYEVGTPNYSMQHERYCIAIAKDMRMNAHTSLEMALNKHIFSWESRLKDQWQKQLDAETAAYGDSQIPPWFKSEEKSNG